MYGSYPTETRSQIQFFLHLWEGIYFCGGGEGQSTLLGQEDDAYITMHRRKIDASFSAHAHNSATELSQSVVPPYGTVYLRHCVLLTIICSFAGF